ncbi:MAG: hypothetical protein U5J98_03165 [Halobacteriales archaeon]|nr:hypothetical protein [Halobacteriales archaeon]
MSVGPVEVGAGARPARRDRHARQDRPAARPRGAARDRRRGGRPARGEPRRIAFRPTRPPDELPGAVPDFVGDILDLVGRSSTARSPARGSATPSGPARRRWLGRNWRRQVRLESRSPTDPFTLLQLGGPPTAGERLLGVVLGVLVGGFALFVSSRFLAEVDGYDHAVLTALIGALAWALLGDPPPGPVHSRSSAGSPCSSGGTRSAGCGRAPWAWSPGFAAVVTVAALQLVGIDAVGAVGVPGV